MFADISGWDIASYVRFARQTHKGAIIIVEGQKDTRALGGIFDPALVNLEISYGKGNLLEALDLLEDEGFEGVLAIADADFDRIDGVVHQLDNLFLADGHDIDMTIATSPALERYLEEFADPDKLEAFKANCDTTLVEALCGSLAYLSTCRWVSEKNNLMLDFKSLEFDFINQADLSCDEVSLRRVLVAGSPATCITTDQLRQIVEAQSSSKVDQCELCNGHDFCTILGIAMRTLLGKLSGTQTYGSSVEGVLRLTFNFGDLKSTQLFAGLLEWEKENSGYPLFENS